MRRLVSSHLFTLTRSTVAINDEELKLESEKNPHKKEEEPDPEAEGGQE